MDKIDFSVMKTRVALRLGNMQTGDPFYTYLGDWVNTAGNHVITRALSKRHNRKLNLFPELYDYWVDTTVLNQGYISLPTDVLFVDEMYHFETTGAVDLSTTDRHVMTEEKNRRSWQMQDRATTVTGYPTKWRRYGNRIEIHPTPRTGYTTKTLMVGFARESTLSGDTDQFVMDALWHPAVIDYAVYLGATDQGWDEDASIALIACDRKLEETLTIIGQENASDYEPHARVANDPTYRR